jgi:hypothetical protein
MKKQIIILVLFTLLFSSCSSTLNGVVKKEIKTVTIDKGKKLLVDKCKTKSLHLPADMKLVSELKIDNMDTDIGIWMFNKDNKIAHWLGRPHKDKSVLEPINVIWIDNVSENEAQSQIKILEFMLHNGFFIEPYSSTLHSYGYKGLYMIKDKNRILKPQFPINSAWVSRPIPLSNNHARIFPAKKNVNKNHSLSFITSGAFSRENSALVKKCRHSFNSFNIARDSLTTLENNWKVQNSLLHLENEYPLKDDIDFTTGDHNGVKVFILNKN